MMSIVATWWWFDFTANEREWYGEVWKSLIILSMRLHRGCACERDRAAQSVAATTHSVRNEVRG